MNAADIRALGVDTVTDLLKAMAGMTRSGRGQGEDPILLLNGRRTSGPGEVQSLPAEAILRFDIFTEQEAVRYGYSSSQRVINIVTLRNYRSIKIDLTGGTTTDGGGDQGTTGITLTRITDSRRINIGLTYNEKGEIREGQRGVKSMEGLYDPIGNVTGIAIGSIDPALNALVGRSVTVGGVPDAQSTLAGFARLAAGRDTAMIGVTRTVQPATRNLNLNAVVADRVLGSVSASINASVGLTQSRALQGKAPAILSVPGSNPFSPFTDDILLSRYTDSVAPLSQTNTGIITHVGLNLSGSRERWNWSVTGGYDRSDVRTSNERGIDLSAIQTAITDNDALLDPFARLSVTRLGTRLVDTGRSTSSMATATAMIGGSPFSLPAGNAFTSIILSGETSRLTATSLQSGIVQRVALPRDTGSARGNLDLPILRAGEGVLALLGNVDANFNLGVSNVSRFGRLTSYGYGVNWIPISPFGLNLLVTHEEKVPSASQLVSATIVTPNVQTFDYTRGVTSLTTLINGGNSNLAAETNSGFSIGLSLRPLARQQLFVNVNYVASSIRNLVNNLPAATATIEAAFPDRFVRDANGTLLSIDTRPINLAHEDRREVNTTVFFSQRINKPSSSPAGSSVGQSSTKDPALSGSMTISLTHVWRLRDVVELRSGLPLLDLLDGDVVGGVGGQARHEVKLDVSRSTDGIGLGVNTSWQSGTRAVAADPTNTLRFSSLIKINAKAFSDLDQLPGWSGHTWAHQLRITLAIDNLLQRRLRVTNRLGKAPSGYDPVYLDPIGRFISLSMRKLF